LSSDETTDTISAATYTRALPEAKRGCMRRMAVAAKFRLESGTEIDPRIA